MWIAATTSSVLHKKNRPDKAGSFNSIQLWINSEIGVKDLDVRPFTQIFHYQC